MSDENNAGSTAALKQKLQVEKPPEQLEAEVREHPAFIELEEKANRLLRLLAENDNTLKRLTRDVESAHKYALDKFTKELLPIIDNLERAMAAHAAEDVSTGSLYDGVNLTLQMFTACLEKFGVQQIDPVGQPFNPDLHQAVSAQEDATVAPNTVLNVLQKGYLLNSRLVRPAMVMVSKAPH